MPNGIIASAKQRHKQQFDPIAKSRRDVEALKNKARFVIVLEDNGKTRVIDNNPKLFPGTKIVPLLAVVTTVTESGEIFPASVLEIGYNRTRPYRRVHVNRNKVYLQNRSPNREMTREQFETTYPLILKCLEEILEETRFSWKSDEPWHTNGKVYERGVQFTVNKADTMLCQTLLREAERYLDNCVLPDYVYVLNRLLRYSQFTSYRTYGPNVQRAAESVMASSYRDDAFTHEVVMRQVGNRTLLENALIDMHSFQSEPSFESRLAFGENLADVPKATGLFFWYTPDQPRNAVGTHADNCCRFEVLFDRQNPKSRHTITKASHLDEKQEEENTYDPNDLDDIPF